MSDATKVELNILWVDDDADFFSGMSERIRSKYKYLNIMYCEGGQDIEQILEGNLLDILVFDYELNGDDTGLDLIRKIQWDHEFCEIFLYSSQKMPPAIQNINAKIVEQRVDLENDIKTAIRIIYSQMQSCNNLRGKFIFLAIDIENTLKDIILENIFFKHKDIFANRILNEEHFTFTNKYKFLVRYLREIKFVGENNNILHVQKKQLQDGLKKFEDEIICIRNLLAHSKMNYKGEIKGVKKDIEWYIDARKKVLKHKKNLMEIKKMLEKNKDKIKYDPELKA